MAFSFYRCDVSKTIKLYEHEKALFMAHYLQLSCDMIRAFGNIERYVATTRCAWGVRCCGTTIM